MRIHVTRAAERELDVIFIYWAERAGLATADKIIDAILERFALLGEHPAAGRACPEIAPRVRCFPAGRHLIYYRKSRRALEILHVFHGAREQARAFSSEPSR
ncbi:MAG TPA: type II toxin-antitoxin system RelE/ParE family toxin [Terracidiphilus sp.]|jgi:toxin ParE1/3/4|nr:type II toxin-antitoxin system RelE/ParE family toxin [Terracidiphilus sp.]